MTMCGKRTQPKQEGLTLGCGSAVAIYAIWKVFREDNWTFIYSKHFIGVLSAEYMGNYKS